MPAVAYDQQGSSKFQRVPNPPALPGHCASCGYAGGEDRDFLDFNLSIDFFGAVIFCDQCVAAMAQVLGYATPSRYDEVTSRLEQVTAANIELERSNDSLRSAMSDLLRGTDTYSNRDLVVEPEARNQEDGEQLELPFDYNGDTESDVNGDDSGTKESSSEQGSDDVRNTTSEQSDYFGI